MILKAKPAKKLWGLVAILGISATIVGGDFFAIAYNESWEGYNLSW